MTIDAEFMSEAEAAAVLGAKISTLRVWWSTSRKGPPRIKVGRKVLYRRESLCAWLRAQESTMPQRGRASRAPLSHRAAA